MSTSILDPQEHIWSEIIQYTCVFADQPREGDWADDRGGTRHHKIDRLTSTNHEEVEVKRGLAGNCGHGEGGGSCEEGAGVEVGERGFCRADRRAVPQKAGQASRETVVFMKFFYFLRHKRREGSEKMHSYAEIRLHSVEGSLVCPL